MFDYEAMKTAMADLDEESLKEQVSQVMANGGDAQKALEACQAGMEQVGKLFEEGEYFVGDLIFAGEIMVDVMEELKSALAGTGEARYGKMILCTVKDDLHDIGKNIVKAMLEAGGFEVLDLGIDVAPETIVAEVKANDIKIVALSGVLTLALDSMKETVAALKEAGLEDVKVIIGGNPVTADAAEAMGADEWAYSPQKTVAVCQNWAK